MSKRSEDHDKRYRSPRAARALLHRLLGPARRAEIEGDLEEQFSDQLAARGAFWARLHYWGELLLFLRPHFLQRPANLDPLGGPLMTKNYLRLTLRTLWKHKGYTFVNIAGLVVGMACFLLIMLFVRFEHSYDAFHEKADRTYRMIAERPPNTFRGSDFSPSTSVPLAEALRADFPEVASVTRMSSGTFNAVFTSGDRQAFEGGRYADEHLFEVFTFPWIRGEAATALSEPNTIVLTASMASRYFGEEDPLGKTLTLRQGGEPSDVRITGIIGEVPPNSHVSFDFLISLQTDRWYHENLDEWSNTNYYTYFVLREGASVEAFTEKLPAFTRAHLSQNEYYSNNPDRMINHRVQPLTDIHLYSYTRYGLSSTGDIKYIYMFSGIALIILLIACINYTNLTTARSATRAKEVGMRKVVGAYRRHLVQQFMGESILLALVAVGFAFLLVRIALSTFNMLVARSIPASLLYEGPSLGGVLVIGLVVGLAAGGYPAVVLSALNPISILKGGGGRGSRKALLRNILVVCQFSITIILIIGTVVIQRQLQYMRGKDTGLNREQVVVLPARGPEIIRQYPALKSELLAQPSVLSVSTTTHPPTRLSSQTSVTDWDGHEGEERLALYQAIIDYDFLDLFGIELVEGRPFSEEIATDVDEALLVNEATLRHLGWDSGVGKSLDMGSRGTRVVGVMKDFHFRPLHEEIAPLAFYLNPRFFQNVLVKIDPENVSTTIRHLENTMQAFSPGYPFDYYFLDEAYARMYETEERLGTLFRYFTALALTIACLGLFGLAAFSAGQRRKEIGVRKALGASLTDIVLLLSKDFTRLVLLAFILALPVSYLAISRWLQDFAYRIDISWPIFLLAGLAALLAALCTVSYQALKAARTNPVDALRYE